MWECPVCSKVFTDENRYHSCHYFSFDGLFSKDGELQEVFSSLLEELLEIGVFSIKAVKKAVYFKNRVNFLYAGIKKGHLSLSFFSDFIIDDPRISANLAISKNRIEHKVNINKTSDIDKKLSGWLRYSYELADGKTRNYELTCGRCEPE